MTYYTFRLDDITDTMNWTNFLRLKAIFDKHGVKPLIGLVPDCKDPKLIIDEPREDYWTYIKSLEEDGWVLAQHGFHHVYQTKNPGVFHLERKSEFAGIPFEKQRQMIEKGKEILEGHNIKTNVFFAPANTYDKNTFKALRLNGYSIIPSSYTTMPYHDYGMLFLPGKYAEPVEAKGFVTIYLHTNTIKDDLYDKIDEFIKTHRDEVVNYSEFIHLGESTKAYFIPKIELGYYIIKNRLKRFVKKILYKGKR